MNGPKMLFLIIFVPHLLTKLKLLTLIVYSENSENEMEMEQEHGEQEQQVPQVPEQQRHAQQ